MSYESRWYAEVDYDKVHNLVAETNSKNVHLMPKSKHVKKRIMVVLKSLDGPEAKKLQKANRVHDWATAYDKVHKHSYWKPEEVLGDTQG